MGKRPLGCIFEAMPSMPVRESAPAVWVTRPAGQNAGLIAALAAQGIEGVEAPLLQIEPVPDPQRAVQVARLLDDFAWVFFVSRNAAQLGVTELRAHRPWPPGPPVATVGAGSAAVLRALGFTEVWYPRSGADSEHVLAEPWTQPDAVKGSRVLIVKGEGGRTLLAQALRDRGAEVVEFVCYRRLPPRWSEAVWAPWHEGRLHGLILTSSEAAAHLPSVVPPSLWDAVRRLPVVASHPRIAAVLQRQGWERVACAAAPDEKTLAQTMARCLGEGS